MKRQLKPLPERARLGGSKRRTSAGVGFIANLLAAMKPSSVFGCQQRLRQKTAALQDTVGTGPVQPFPRGFGVRLSSAALPSVRGQAVGLNPPFYGRGYILRGFHSLHGFGLTVFLFATVLSFSAFATPFREAEVRKAVETWVHHFAAQPRPDAQIESVQPYVRDGVTAAYIVQFANQGYCLAGADSLVLPVYWYCPDGKYDPQNPGCKVILREIADRLDYLKNLKATSSSRLKLHQTDLDERAALWTNLVAGSSTSETSPDVTTKSFMPRLQLPLKSAWAQGSCYNDDCPMFINLPGDSDNRTVVGCVGTAMAQVMYYWRWPNSGVGTANNAYHYRVTSTTLTTPLAINPMIPVGWAAGRLTWSAGTLSLMGSWDDSLLSAAKQINNNSDFQNAVQSLYDSMSEQQTPLFVDFGAATYDWSIMRNTNSDPPTGSSLEAAQISYHAGMSVNMKYGTAESGSSSSAVPGAMSQHFRYDSDVTDNSVDPNKIVEEIQWLRPLLMAGDNTTDGHCWIIFGYDETKNPWQFDMNMGWGPGSTGLYSFDKVPLGLTNNLDQVTRIAPKDVVRFVGASGSGSGSPSSPYQNIEEAVNKAANDTTLIFKAGSYNSFAASQLFVNKPLVLKGINATIGK